MIYSTELLILIGIMISIGAKTNSYDIDKVTASKVRNVRKINRLRESKKFVQSIDFEKLFKTLHRNHSPEEIRIITTIGLLSGALRTAETMRENIYKMTDDLLDSFNKSTPKENIYKLFAIEETINRDKSTVAILNGMLQCARNVTTMEALEKDMKQIFHENEVASKRLRSEKSAIDQDIKRSDQNGASTGKLLTHSRMNLKYTVKEKLYDVREMIDNHVDNVHSSLTENVKQTIGYIRKWQKRNENLMKRNGKHKVKLDKSLDGVKRLWDQVEQTNSDIDYKKPQSNIDFTIDEIRITKGEELAVDSTSKPKVIVNIDRFKRQNTGSDSSSFIKSLISGLVHVFSKAVASSAAGSSQGSLSGSASFSGGSSHGSSASSSKPKDDGHKERKR